MMPLEKQRANKKSSQHTKQFNHWNQQHEKEKLKCLKDYLFFYLTKNKTTNLMELCDNPFFYPLLEEFDEEEQEILVQLWTILPKVLQGYWGY